MCKYSELSYKYYIFYWFFSGYEFDHFYEEQKQRLDYLNHEPVFLKDFLCQMADLFKPEDDIKYILACFFF